MTLEQNGDKQVYSAITIGDEILKSAKNIGRALTPMQLTKLVYIAHGWSLAVLERDLFSDRIEAWKFGPVVPSIYHATKQHGRNPIPLDLVDVEAQPSVDEEVKAFLDDVVSKYSHLNGIELSNLTHQPDSPWAARFRPGVMNIEIEDELIKNHYVKKLNEHRRSTATQ